MRRTVLLLVAGSLAGGVATASVPATPDRQGFYLAKHDGTPPGLAKKGGVPPGLAKWYGPALPAKAYIAVDPRHDDRAWFLVDGHWVLHEGFDQNVRLEVRSCMNLPPVPEPPPVPLPKVAIGFHVVLFN